MVGAPGTLYANDTYQLQVDFPEHYPMESPQVSVQIIHILVKFIFRAVKYCSSKLTST